MNKKRWAPVIIGVIFLAVIFFLILFGIVPSDPIENNTSSTSSSESSSMLSTQEEAETAIQLNEDSITVDGSGAVVDGTTVTISQAGSYHLSGTLTDGQIVINASKDAEVRLILSNVSLTYTQGTPLNVIEAGTVYIISEDGTENTVTDTENYVFASGADEPDAAIFSKADLVFDGAGTLIVNGNYSMAIHGKDSVSIIDGTYNLFSVGDGLKGKDNVTISNGTVTIDAGEDGIQSNNDTDDGMGNVSINGGIINITAGKDGIKAETNLAVLDGTISVISQEDGLHSTQFVQVSGGTFSIDAQQDGIQAGNTLEITDGSLNITTGGGASNAPEHTEQMGFPGWFDTSTTEETDSAKGLKSDGDLTVSGGVLLLDCMDDALHCADVMTISDSADLTISTGDDGLHSDNTLAISGGSINITKSYEGLEAIFIEISGGETTLFSSDDGLNAAGGSSADTDFDFMGPPGGQGISETLEDATYYIYITGGVLHVNSGGDGLDSNGAIFIDGGEIYVSGPSDSMNGGLDYTTTGQVNGGTVVVTGFSGMAQNFDNSSAQVSVMYTFDHTISAGSQITLRDNSGNILVDTTMTKTFNNILISLPTLTVGEAYTLTCGSEQTEITISDTITTLGNSNFGMAPGGEPGNMGGGFGGMRPPG